jgi:asparagine synthase (glutamine-hydrolysing)
MCGITGISSHSKSTTPELLTAMRDTLRHRGPDDTGIWTSKDGLVGLGHCRLAIIDTSEGGHQPMQDVSGKLCITYNGEIYNYRELRKELEAKSHRFRTASDTEVILEAYRAWGTDCLERFNGVFAFGLYDSDARKLFIARDRPGEKPLFYWHARGGLAFASELKALMANPEIPRVLDLEALDYYLAYGYVPGARCILKGVRKLPQGHAMTYDLEKGALDIWRYWQLPEQVIDEAVSADDLVDEVKSLLEDAVRLRLVADVPVGILLSGGIDSSLVTAMAARVSSKPMKTFTISFRGHGAFDEGPYARIVAEHFGTDHTELVPEAATYELLPELARQYDGAYLPGFTPGSAACQGGAGWRRRR